MLLFGSVKDGINMYLWFIGGEALAPSMFHATNNPLLY